MSLKQVLYLKTVKESRYHKTIFEKVLEGSEQITLLYYIV